jgi:IMP cyclohydrolase
LDFATIASANEAQLKNNPYPGRGIIIGRTPDSKNYVQVYWIMGRSTNSRNRVFVQENNFIRTKAFDESKMVDPSLIIYYPMKEINNKYIVTNGDQTETIYDFLKQNKSIEDALKTREFEPDAPNFTPRISGLLDLNGNPSYTLSVLKAQEPNPDACLRIFYYYDDFISGYGHCIHTYRGDGDPLPSFTGDPEMVRMFDNIDQTVDFYWNILDESNKVSIAVKFVNCEKKDVTVRIINKLK